MKLLILVVATVALAQDPWQPQPAAQPAWTGHQQPAAQPAARGPHEVQPSPGPGPFVHKDFHPPPTNPVPWNPIGPAEQRLRRIEVFLNLIDPECRNPYNGPMRELRRMTYASDPQYIYHASEPAKQDTARRAGYTQEVPLGRIATEPYDPACECLVPLYRRNYNNHVYRVVYRTKDNHPCRRDFLTSKDYPPYDYMGDLKNWAIEGYCVPYRGACGANLQLSAMTPTKKLGDDRPLTLVTADEDRVAWGYEKGWDETTLCYIWN